MGKHTLYLTSGLRAIHVEKLLVPNLFLYVGLKKIRSVALIRPGEAPSLTSAPFSPPSAPRFVTSGGGSAAHYGPYRMAEPDFAKGGASAVQGGCPGGAKIAPEKWDSPNLAHP